MFSFGVIPFLNRIRMGIPTKGVYMGAHFLVSAIIFFSLTHTSMSRHMSICGGVHVLHVCGGQQVYT